LYIFSALCGWEAKKHKHRYVTKGKSYHIRVAYDDLIAAERLAAIPFCGSLSGHEMRDLFE